MKNSPTIQEWLEQRIESAELQIQDYKDRLSKKEDFPVSDFSAHMDWSGTDIIEISGQWREYRSILNDVVKWTKQGLSEDDMMKRLKEFLPMEMTRRVLYATRHTIESRKIFDGGSTFAIASLTEWVLTETFE